MKVATVLLLALLGLALGSRDFLSDLPPPMKPAIIDGPPGADQMLMDHIQKVLKSEPASASTSPDAGKGMDDIFALDEVADGDSEEIAAADAAADQDQSIAAANEEEKNLKEEMKVLKQLIERGSAIMQAMPQKKKRLEELEKRFNVAEDSIAEHKAEQQLEQQEQLLADIKAKIAQMETKLKELKDTKQKLEASIAKTRELEEKAKKQMAEDKAGLAEAQESEENAEDGEEEEEGDDAESTVEEDEY